MGVVTTDMDRVALLRRIIDLEMRLNERDDPALRAEYNVALEAGEDRYGWPHMTDFYRRLSMSRRTWWPDSITQTRH